MLGIDIIYLPEFEKRLKKLSLEKIYPRGSKIPKKGKCRVIFGKPLEFTTETPSKIIQKSREALLNLTAN